MKTTAEERSVPLPRFSPGANAHCSACGADSPAEKCSTRADGFAECPDCGGPVELRAKSSSTRVDELPPSLKDAPKPDGSKPLVAHANPTWKYCGTCGSEWPVVKGSYFINCGHMMAQRIEDPRKATKYGPPAPLGVRVDHEKARRDADDAKAPHKSSSADDAPSTVLTTPPNFGFGAPTSVVTSSSSNRLSIAWGESRMPVDQWNNFKCGGHIITVEIPPGEDRLKVAEKILHDLEAIAELLFCKQLAWYQKKLKVLSA